MRLIIFFMALIFSTNVYASEFIHPMDFDGSEEQKEKVIKYIEEKVREDYCNGALDMCQPTTLRMMENQNMQAFKEAIKATDRVIMDRVIKDYCNGAISMCSYTTILMMYKQNKNANEKSLEW